MNRETPKPPRPSRLCSFPPFLFVSSTPNPFHQPPPPPSNDPKHKSPESESIEANMEKKTLSSASASSSEIPRGEENTRSSSSPLIFRHSQVNSISATRVSYSCSNSLNTNPQVSHSSAAEEKRDELLPETTSSGRRDCLLRVVTDASIPSSSEQGFVSSSSSETTRRRGSNNFLRVMEIMDEQDLGKHLLGLAIPMGVALVVSASSLVKTTGMHIVATALSFAIVFMWNGLLLRKTCTNSSPLILISGAALMMLSFYSFVGCYLPLYLKWIPVLCWLSSLVPLAMYGWAYLARDKMKEPEKEESIISKGMP